MRWSRATVGVVLRAGKGVVLMFCEESRGGSLASGQSAPPVRRIGAMTEGAAPDELDRAIIRELERDGRQPFREIGRSLGVSEATVRARYRRLTDSGLLRVVAFADPTAHGNL